MDRCVNATRIHPPLSHSAPKTSYYSRLSHSRLATHHNSLEVLLRIRGSLRHHRYGARPKCTPATQRRGSTAAHRVYRRRCRSPSRCPLGLMRPEPAVPPAGLARGGSGLKLARENAPKRLVGACPLQKGLDPSYLDSTSYRAIVSITTARRAQSPARETSEGGHNVTNGRKRRRGRERRIRGRGRGIT